ncbi:GEVED domain-containing protein [Tamlana sp. I1]|uniref:GEVED domain-containing protein n=1 Tax=Tamlana sp. I1 TaxID=2762061 RepID=UPI00188FD357|nr:GEVED domain-containing protein [Tamlana sp. I1]
MKKLLLLSIFMLASFFGFSQNQCGVTPEYTQQQIALFKKTYKVNFNAKTVFADPSPSNIQRIPLAVYLVRNTDGSFSENKDLIAFRYSLIETNRILSQLGIQFYIDRFAYLDNSSWVRPERGSTEHNALLANKTPNMVNVWINDGWSGPGAAATATGYGGVSGVELKDTTEATVPHEFGHFLTLAHTFEIADGVELVNGSNCATAGDKICDTAADPGTNGVTITNCMNANGATDSNGDVYSPPIDNIMSYFGGSCGMIFTPQQYDRMKAGFNQYHTAYVGDGEITTAPTGLMITHNPGYDELSWTNAASQRGTLVEYSPDGTSWHVMNGVLDTENTLILSEIKKGTNYKLRARHLNSKTYSAVLDYSPTENHVFVPYVVHRDEAFLGGIGEFVVANTPINNTSNKNNSFSIITYPNTPELFIGGSNDVILKILTGSGGQGGFAFFLIYLDENGDGDFDDPGELKYQHPDNNLEFTVNTKINISATATEGFTRLRVRTTAQNASENPTEFFNFSETEDYVVKLVTEQPPVLAGTFNSTTNEVELTWTDPVDTNKYDIERSIDGVNFTKIGSTADGTTKNYNDKTAPPNSQVEYRVKKETGTAYSNVVAINTPNTTTNYCPPISTNGCENNYGITKLSIVSIAFENDSNGTCGTTSTGYSDYFNSKTMNLTAGTTYTIDRENINYGPQGNFAVFLDSNQDGDFNYTVANQSAASIQITIPSDATNGETRIRFRLYFNTITDACADANFGETEDYKVIISGGKESSVINAMADNATDTSLNLSWDIASGASPTGFQINSSTDGTTFTPLATLGASDRTYAASGLASGTKHYFQIIANGTQNSDAKLVWGTTTGALGVEDAIAQSVKVYPNPTNNGRIHIKTTKQLNSVKILDVRGALIKEIKNPVLNTQNEYIIENLSQGFNILSLNVEGRNLIKKIIVN